MGIVTAYGQSFFPSTLPIQSGDLIFREGTAIESDIVRSYNDDIYSHVGMLYQEGDAWRVIHATPAEKEGRESSVVMDDLSFYLDPSRSGRYQIYRIQSASDIQYHQAIQYTLNQLGRPFHYDENRGTYCTRLLYDAWLASEINLNVDFISINLPIIKGEYLFPSQLRASPHIELIYEGNVNEPQ